MAINRFEKSFKSLTKNQKKNLTNGPGKLSIAFQIDKTLNAVDLCGDILYLENGVEEEINIIETTRIGIDYAEEARYFPYRYYIKGNAYVSKV